MLSTRKCIQRNYSFSNIALEITTPPLAHLTLAHKLYFWLGLHIFKSCIIKTEESTLIRKVYFIDRVA